MDPPDATLPARPYASPADAREVHGSHESHVEQQTTPGSLERDDPLTPGRGLAHDPEHRQAGNEPLRGHRTRTSGRRTMVGDQRDQYSSSPSTNSTTGPTDHSRQINSLPGTETMVEPRPRCHCGLQCKIHICDTGRNYEQMYFRCPLEVLPVPLCAVVRPATPPQLGELAPRPTVNNHPEDPILKNQSYYWPKKFSIILKMVNLEAKKQYQYNIGHDIGQYWFQILIMLLIMVLVNIDRGDPVEFLWRSCGVPV